MALVGKWTKIEYIQSETETEIVTVEHPSAEIMGANHPNIDKAGTIEEVEFPVVKKEETIFENVYVVIYSINYFKNAIFVGSQRNQMNICWKVYDTKEAAIEDPFNCIYEGHIIKKEADLSRTDKNLSEQAYDFLMQEVGFEELIKD